MCSFLKLGNRFEILLFLIYSCISWLLFRISCLFQCQFPSIPKEHMSGKFHHFFFEIATDKTYNFHFHISHTTSAELFQINIFFPSSCSCRRRHLSQSFDVHVLLRCLLAFLNLFVIFIAAYCIDFSYLLTYYCYFCFDRMGRLGTLNRKIPFNF